MNVKMVMMMLFALHHNDDDVQSVDEVVRQGRLRWFGHVERKSGDD